MVLSRRRLGLLLPALAARPARAASFTMQLSTTAAGDVDVEWLEQFKKNVESLSGGQIRANVYPGSQLGSGPTTAEGVALGTIEVAVNASGTFEGLEPRFAVLAVPGLVEDMAQGTRLLTASSVRAQLAAIGRDKGFEVIVALPAAPAVIVSRRPIKTLADFNGMKIRVPGSASLIEQIRQLGAGPISMSLGEVLPAFQNGTIDGVYGGITVFTPLKYYDIAKNLTALPATVVSMLGIISNSFMEAVGPLAPVVREAAQQAAAGSAVWGEKDVFDKQAIWEKNGGQTFTLPPEDAQRYLDIAVPAALSALSPAARADYAALKALAKTLQ